MTDFGAEEAFAGAAAELKEHYGVVVPVRAVGEITEEHRATMLAQEKQKSDGPDYERTEIAKITGATKCTRKLDN